MGNTSARHGDANKLTNHIDKLPADDRYFGFTNFGNKALKIVRRLDSETQIFTDIIVSTDRSQDKLAT